MECPAQGRASEQGGCAGIAGRSPGKAHAGRSHPASPEAPPPHSTQVQAISVSSRFEEEIKAEQEERKKQAEEMKQRKAAFKELQSTFK